MYFGCFKTNKLVSPVKYNGKYGFIDDKGNWVIQPKYDSLDIFYNGYSTSFSDGKEGIINRKGILIVNHNYSFIDNVEEKIALVMDEKDRVNFVTTKGQLISKNYFHDGENFENGLAPVQFNKEGKWGFINTIGEIEIDTIYDFAEAFKQGKANVEIGDLELIINTKGIVIDTFQYQKTKRSFRLIGNSNAKTLGKINSKGDTIMPMNFESFGYLQEKYFWFNTGEYYGLADTTGKIISGIKYEYLSYFSDNGLALAKFENKYGFINKECETVIDFIFEEAKGFKYNLAAVKKDDKWGFINSKGEFKIKPKFENVAHQFRPIYAKHEPIYNYKEK